MGTKRQTKRKPKRKAKQPHRHRYGAMREGSFEDGTYQTCACGATRFKGDRYAYGSRRDS